MRPYSLACLLLAGWLAGTLASSCSRDANPALPSGGNSAGAAALPAGLPAPDELLRRETMDSLGFVLGQRLLPGGSQGRLETDNGGIRFLPLAPTDPDPAGFAWGVYRVPLSDSGPLSLAMDWHIPPAAGTCYIGIGNIADNRWEWSLLADPPAELEWSAAADYISGEQQVLLAFVLLPGAGQPVLDHFALATLPASGWRFVELDATSAVGSAFDGAIALQARIISGRPAIVYGMRDAAGSETLRLAICNTVSGAAAADWEMLSLEGEFYSAAGLDMADFDGGFGIINVVPFGNPAAPTLVWHFAGDPHESFSNEAFMGAPRLVNPRLGRLDSGPAITMQVSGSPSDDFHTLLYAFKSRPDDLSWAVCDVYLDLPDIPGTSGTTAPFSINGGPAFGYCTDAGGGQYEFRLASSVSSFPSSADDWNHLLLGEGRDSAMYATELNGHILLGSQDSQPAMDGDVRFWTYEFTGSEPQLFESWQISSYDMLGLGQSPVLGLAGGGTELHFLQGSPQASTALDGQQQPLSHWSSSAPGNDPADWQLDTAMADYPAGLTSFVLVDGQPAFARLFSLAAGSGAAVRTQTKLLWAVYVP
ncbi:MAG: hypothetical protein R3F46_15540 [bacterium]